MITNQDQLHADTELVSEVVKVQMDIIRKFPHSKRVGNYLLGRTLGEGAFAKVKESLHLITTEKVAVKIVDKKRAEGDSYVKKNMRREGRILQSLQHPNVTRLYEVLETENSYYLVMELCKEDLMDYIQKKRYLHEREVKRLIRQLMSAVYYIHRLGIVHRDLKIENLLLDEKNNIKLIDFGLSSCTKLDRVGGTTEALCSTQCGSPAYAAPELLGQKRYGAKVDVWSVGINMYAMLTGNLPFTVEPFNLAVLYKKMLSGDHNPLPQNLTKDGAEFLHLLLHPNPELRLSSASALEHIWLRKESAKNPLVLESSFSISGGVSNLNFAVIAHMTKNQGYPYNDLLRDVTANIPSVYTAVYHLWIRRLHRHNRFMQQTSNKISSLGQECFIKERNGGSAGNRDGVIDLGTCTGYEKVSEKSLTFSAAGKQDAMQKETTSATASTEKNKIISPKSQNKLSIVHDFDKLQSTQWNYKQCKPTGNRTTLASCQSTLFPTTHGDVRKNHLPKIRVVSFSKKTTTLLSDKLPICKNFSDDTIISSEKATVTSNVRKKSFSFDTSDHQSNEVKFSKTYKHTKKSMRGSTAMGNNNLKFCYLSAGKRKPIFPSLKNPTRGKGNYQNRIWQNWVSRESSTLPDNIQNTDSTRAFPTKTYWSNNDSRPRGVSLDITRLHLIPISLKQQNTLRK